MLNVLYTCFTLTDQALAALREFLLALGCIGTATSAQEIVFFWGLLSNWLLLEKDLDFIGLSLYEVVHICQGAVALFDKVCLEGGRGVRAWPAY